ncbi:transmembrane protein-related [Anaeramoeba flamelloides]|uniref:Transmembrane protein-related n=1 Tax=Anaeramoeba flamelloides TaxID=1746091 RepID=A0ABQ8XGA1_9EUKA|nr:transmembrane protein-related [Anaeramoeba flamelloides]
MKTSFALCLIVFVIFSFQKHIWIATQEIDEETKTEWLPKISRKTSISIPADVHVRTVWLPNFEHEKLERILQKTVGNIDLYTLPEGTLLPFSYNATIKTSPIKEDAELKNQLRKVIEKNYDAQTQVVEISKPLNEFFNNLYLMDKEYFSLKKNEENERVIYLFETNLPKPYCYSDPKTTNLINGWLTKNSILIDLSSGRCRDLKVFQSHKNKNININNNKNNINNLNDINSIIYQTTIQDHLNGPFDDYQTNPKAIINLSYFLYNNIKLIFFSDLYQSSQINLPSRIEVIALRNHNGFDPSVDDPSVSYSVPTRWLKKKINQATSDLITDLKIQSYHLIDQPAALIAVSGSTIHLGHSKSALERKNSPVSALSSQNRVSYLNCTTFLKSLKRQLPNAKAISNELINCQYDTHCLPIYVLSLQDFSRILILDQDPFVCVADNAGIVLQLQQDSKSIVTGNNKIINVDPKNVKEHILDASLRSICSVVPFGRRWDKSKMKIIDEVFWTDSLNLNHLQIKNRKYYRKFIQNICKRNLLLTKASLVIKKVDDSFLKLWDFWQTYIENPLSQSINVHSLFENDDKNKKGEHEYQNQDTVGDEKQYHVYDKEKNKISREKNTNIKNKQDLYIKKNLDISKSIMFRIKHSKINKLSDEYHEGLIKEHLNIINNIYETIEKILSEFLFEIENSEFNKNIQLLEAMNEHSKIIENAINDDILLFKKHLECCKIEHKQQITLQNIILQNTESFSDSPLYLFLLVLLFFCLVWVFKLVQNKYRLRKHLKQD